MGFIFGMFCVLFCVKIILEGVIMIKDWSKEVCDNVRKRREHLKGLSKLIQWTAYLECGCVVIGVDFKAERP